MSYQRGCLKKVRRKEGETWVLRFRITNAEGRRVEPTPLTIGLVADFPKASDAWREVDKQGLRTRINEAGAFVGRTSFRLLAEHYLKADFGAEAVRPKSVNTTEHVKCVLRKYLVPRFGDEIAEDIKPLDIQRWLKSLHEQKALAWTTIAKMRGIMRRVYKIGILHELVSRNPVLQVETRSKTDYRAIVITLSKRLLLLTTFTPRFTPRWCLPARRQRFALPRYSRCAGATFCGRKVGFGCASAGPREQTEKRKQMRRTATSRCIRSLPETFAHGTDRRPMRRNPTLCFRLSERGAAFLSPLRFSSPTTCDRLQRKPEFRSRTVNGSDCTTFGTHCLTGW